jgi:hypothetical protein
MTSTRLLHLRFVAGRRAKSTIIELKENSFETHNCPKPSISVKATSQELLSLFKTMNEIRRLEMACDSVY